MDDSKTKLNFISDINSLDPITKKLFLECLKAVANEADIENIQEREITLEIDDNDTSLKNLELVLKKVEVDSSNTNTRSSDPGTNTEHIDTIKRPKKKPPNYEAKLNSLGFSERIKKFILDEIEEGNIGKSFIDKLTSTNMIDELVQLDEETQEEILSNIIKNVKEANIINAEEIILYVINNGVVNNFYAERWYKSLLRPANKLLPRLKINADVFKHLSVKNHNKILYKLLSNLEKELNKFNNTLSNTIKPEKN